VLLVAGFAYFGSRVVVANREELSGATDYVRRARLVWVAAAVLTEVAAYAATALLQRRLLAAGRARVGLVPLAAIALAGNAITTSVPGGSAVAAVFAYRQLRRRGADEAVTTWVMVAFASLTALTLAFLAIVGLLISGPDGPVGGLWLLLGPLALGPVLGIAFLLRPRLLLPIASPVLRVARRLTRMRRRPAEILVPLIERIETVRPTLRDWLVSAAFALGNWSADCLCLVAAFRAVGTAVPWRGVLVAYGAAQVAANVPITPGGLGVVEGSLTVALVAYGGSTEGSVAAVLLYRIISFWAALPIGWLAWLGLQVHGRRLPAPAATEVDG
jgi:uncharacterized protein (TIRG00374 family)